MSKNYEGKLGVGQLIFCIFAAATLFIPFLFDPISFAFNHIMPIGDSMVSQNQTTFLNAFFSAINISSAIPEFVTKILPYSIYAFYAIIAYDFLFIILLMIIRVEGLRKFFRVIGILLGFVMLVITVVMLATIVGFVIYYMVGGFGDGAAIFDCIKTYGLAFYTGVFVFAIIATVKQFSSFFGKY